MKYSASSKEYLTIYLKWPQTLPKICPLCQSDIEMKYPNNGKIVHTLQGKINQITYFYGCTNKECHFHTKPFNPQPRFDFDGFYYGRDVVKKVAFYGLKEGFKPAHIESLLKNEHKVKISESTVRRMLALCTVVKAEAIDARSFEIIKAQGGILLGLDGEDPLSDGPALWCFIDLLSNRVLHTVYLESAPASCLQEEIHFILDFYSVKLLGVVSDKQGNIMACLRDYFPDIPHQFCVFHFAQNLWNHIELMDGKLHKQISKILNSSYFLTQTADSAVKFEEYGKLKPKDVFAPIAQELKKLKRIKGKKFESLRVIQLFDHVDEACAQLVQEGCRLPDGYRMQIIFQREAAKWTQGLSEAYSLYDEVMELYDRFKEIYRMLFAEEFLNEEREALLTSYFKSIEEHLKKKNTRYERKNLKSFLPTARSSLSAISGEWVRLWHSYRPGLFKFLNFPVPIKTIVILERGFGQQKSRFYSRVAKKRIGSMIRTEGDYHLRFVFCESEELETDIWEEAIKFNWRQLVSNHNERKQEISSQWLRKKRNIRNILGVSHFYYGERLT
jgi:hypothetical protein